jgi:hypothetical protein
MKQIALGAMGAAAIASLIAACGGGGSGGVNPNIPTEIRTTWFGISNFHYQVGKTGFILDGEVVNSGSAPSPTAVAKALTALRKRGTVDYFLVGHEHGDHALQIPEYAKQTGKPIYAPAAVCQKVAAYGNPASQCTTIKGGETFSLDEYTTVRVVRWLHSIDCGSVGNGSAGVETFGFLITAQAPDKVLSIYASDSGAGGQELYYPRVVNKGQPNEATYGSPFDNLMAAFRASGLSGIDLWQGGPESDVVSQAKIVIPTFKVKYFQPHHLGTRNTTVDGKSVGFSLEYGLHFPYLESEVPKLTAYLKSVGTTAYNPVNYFDAWSLTGNSFKSVDNADVKATYGLPATGAGPGKQGPNPRSGQLECTAS